MRSGEHIFEHPNLNGNLLHSFFAKRIHLVPGGNHTVLVRSDGAALAFGHNGAGQCEIPELPEAGEERCRPQIFRRTHTLIEMIAMSDMICYECCVGLCRQNLGKREFDITRPHKALSKIQV